MKTIATLFIIIWSMMIHIASHAVTRSVSNVPSTTITFSTVQSAVNASSSGDTILVNGSPNTYPPFTISNKRLLIVGPGWSPDKSPAHVARIFGLAITGTASKGTEIQGLVINSTITINGSKPDSIRFVRNKFEAIVMYLNEGGTVYKDYLFEGNWFSNCNPGIAATNSTIYTNFLFRNNIFYLNSGSYSVTDLDNVLSTIVFDHNLWYGPGGGTVNCFAGVANVMFTNNILIRRNANCSSSTFSNNLTFLTSMDSPWLINGNSGALSGNIAGTNPQMVSQTLVDAGSNNALLDFTIQSGSPAKNVASDGKDIGLVYDTVGSLNWANSRNSRFPRIYNMSITNPNISSGGTINVIIEGRSSN